MYTMVWWYDAVHHSSAWTVIIFNKKHLFLTLHLKQNGLLQHHANGGSGSELLVLMRGSLYSARILHQLPIQHHNTTTPPPPQPPPQPSVNATQASVHAISQADSLEVVAVFCPNCLFAEKHTEPFSKAWLPGTLHLSVICGHTYINILQQHNTQTDECINTTCKHTPLGHWLGHIFIINVTQSVIHIYKQQRCFQTLRKGH